MKILEHRKAIALRKRGYSVKEIAAILPIAKSTVSFLVQGVKLNKKAEARIIKRIGLGRLRAGQAKKERVRMFEEKCLEDGRILNSAIYQDVQFAKIMCAMLFWCEGNKNPRHGMYFTNSDPNLIRKFLELLRKSFKIDESKFHPCIHIHEYHDPKKQLDFWSKATNIPKEQFIRPYRKVNTAKRIREGYQGCIGIRYCSNNLARELIGIAKAFLLGV
jgi:predicted transcriptional regulator